MASPIRPQFFCSRPNGTLTPLIALDELPAHVAVRGVPRILSPGDTQGMTSLGTVHPRAQYYIVDGASASPPRGSSLGGQANGCAPQSDLQTSLLKVVADDSLPASQRLALHAFIQQSLAPSQMVTAGHAGPWSTANGHGNASGNGHGNAGQRQVQYQNPKKEFCSYWIRHGECDYQQQGCLYKHEMPTDPGMLERLGLRDIPRWYREKYGISSILSGGGNRPRSYGGTGQPEVQDRGAFKAIQYPARFGMTGTPEILPEAAENGLSRSRTPTYSRAAQQHSIWGQGSSGSAFAAGHVSQGAVVVNRNGVRQVCNSHNQSGRKFDLLSFDPMTDYTPFDGADAGANLGEMSYPTGQVRAPTGEAERVQHDGFLHNVQSAMPGSSNADGFLRASCYGSAPSPSRNKRAQRSRRLYQARSHTHTHITDRELQPASEMQVLPARNKHNNKTGNGAVFSVTTTTATSHVATSSTKKCSNGSSTAAAMSPISTGGAVGSSRMSPGSPSFDNSPSVKSHASSSSGAAGMSPATARLFHGNGSCSFNERDREANEASRSALGVIGTRKVVQQKNSGCESVDDLIGLGLGRGK